MDDLRVQIDLSQNKTEASLPPFFIPRSARSLPEPSRGVGEQGVDHPGFGGEVVTQRRGPAVLARDLVEQSLEFGDVALDRLLETPVGAIFAGDFIEGLLAGRRVEPLGEYLGLATLIAIPHLSCEIAIHQAADVERKRLQRIAANARLRRTAARGIAVAAAGVGAAQQVGEPPIASLLGIGRADRRRFGAAGNWSGRGPGA